MIFARLYTKESYKVFSDLDRDAVGPWAPNMARLQYFIWSDESHIENFEIISVTDFDYAYEVISVQGPVQCVKYIERPLRENPTQLDTRRYFLAGYLSGFQGFTDTHPESLLPMADKIIKILKELE